MSTCSKFQESASFIRNRLRGLALSQHQPLLWFLNISMAAISYMAAYFIRFDRMQLPPEMWTLCITTLPLAVALKIIMLLRFKAFTGLWRYVSTHDLVHLIKAVSAYSLIFATLTLLTVGHRIPFTRVPFIEQGLNIPRSVYLIDYILSLLFFSGVRLSVRLYRELRADTTFNRRGGDRRKRRFLIIGAGDAAEFATRSLTQEANSSNMIVGYIDDDPQKEGRLIHGKPVLGGREKTAEAIRTLRVNDVVFAISDAPRDLTEYIVNACSGMNVSFRILPSFHDIATGHIEVQRIRNVEIEDLLGRQVVHMDDAHIRKDLKGECVLVTGAGGSIGSELARQIAALSPARLLLLDSAETPLFDVQQEVIQNHPELPLETFLCNIKNAMAVDQIFARHRPTRIYHAAAYKHVPMLETHPEQAVLNNACGTRYVAEAACRHGASGFVLISTDKAVHPSSIMGASKRICELVVSAMPMDSGVRFSAVRFGNVLGSNGSVIPTFRRQIAEGGPLTVTHPEMTRFFMTIPEAVQLVLHCGSMAKHNDIFVLDMGTPVRIMDLARNMIRLSGLEPDRDIEIRITGLRPGEKMHEELFTYGEELLPTGVEKINVLRRRPPLLAAHDIMDRLARLEDMARNSRPDAVRDAVWALIRKDTESLDRMPPAQES